MIIESLYSPCVTEREEDGALTLGESTSGFPLCPKIMSSPLHSNSFDSLYLRGR